MGGCTSKQGKVASHTDVSCDKIHVTPRQVWMSKNERNFGPSDIHSSHMVNKNDKNEIEGRAFMLQNQLKVLQKMNDELRRIIEKGNIEKNYLQKKLNETKEKVNQLTYERDDLLKRLSKMTSDCLTNNNPNIADLNDTNRPTKLAERFSELYSNEWTDAYESLTEDYSMKEKAAIKCLLDMLKKIFIECKNKADRTIRMMEDVIVDIYGGKSNQQTSLLLKPYKDERKKNYRNTIPDHQKILKLCFSGDTRNKEKRINTAAVQIYIKSATEICWLMCIQDPPLCLSFECKKKSSFNKDHFKPYTSMGTTVLFLVWPALFLHENGPMLQKGVAQGSKKKKSLSGCTTPTKQPLYSHSMSTYVSAGAQGEESEYTGNMHRAIEHSEDEELTGSQSIDRKNQYVVQPCNNFQSGDSTPDRMVEFRKVPQGKQITLHSQKMSTSTSSA